MKKLFTLIAAIVCTMTLYARGVSFAWQGIRLVHPSNYEITDKDYNDGIYTFSCEIKNEDVFSMMEVSLVINDTIARQTREDAIEVAKIRLDEIAEDMSWGMTKMHLGKTKVNRRHRYVYVYRTFTGSFFGELMWGKFITLINGNKLVTILLITESPFYLRDLKKIANTIQID